jgi:hypothetical protein
LAVGSPVEGSLTIADTGALPGRYLLHTRVSGDKRFAARLHLVVSDSDGGRIFFSGPVTRSSAVAVGRLVPRQQRTLRLEVTLTGAGGAAQDNALQRRRAAVAFGWTATQA